MRSLPLLSWLTVSLAAQVVQAPIQRVRLHPDEAWVTRVARVRLSAGATRLQVKDLPSELTLEDVRVSASGPQGLRLGDVALRSETRKVVETDAYKALKQEQERLRDQRDALEAEGEALAQELAFLKNLQATHDKELSSRMSYALPAKDAVVGLSKGIQERLTALLTRDRKRKRELDPLKEELGRVEAELRQKAAERSVSPTQVDLELSAARAGDAEVELSTRTSRASWMPSYEARLSTDGRQVEWALFAAVRQETGESWDGVRLEITNARASRRLTLAQFPGAQEVGWQETPPPTPASWKTRSAASVVEVVSQNAYVMPAPAQEKHQAEAMEGEPLEEALGVATTWSLEGAKDVPADGQPHRFRILSRDITPELAFLAVPRLDPTVHRVARFPVPPGIPLFPGAPMVHYAGTQRVGETTLAVPAPGQPLQMGFGPYRGARVELKQIDAKKEQVGAFTKETQWTFLERMDVSNDTAESLQVEIQDRELKSTSDRVKISLLSDSTPSQPSRLPGVRLWKLDLAPKSTQSITLHQQIRAPQEGVVTGLGGLRLPR